VVWFLGIFGLHGVNLSCCVFCFLVCCELLFADCKLVVCVLCSCVGSSLVVILIPLSGPLCIPSSCVYLLMMVVLWCVSAFCALKM